MKRFISKRKETQNHFLIGMPGGKIRKVVTGAIGMLVYIVYLDSLEPMGSASELPW